MPMFEAVTLKAGDDVEVGVEDDLAGDGVVVHFDVDAVGIHRTLYCDGKFFYHGHYVRECFVRGVV